MIFIQDAPVYYSSSFWEDELFHNFHKCYAPLHQVKNQSPFYNFKSAGQLILSRYPFTKVEMYSLPSVTKPTLGKNHLLKRVALYAQITSFSPKQKKKNKQNQTIGLYNLHLENISAPQGRKRQLEFLLQIIEKNKDDMVIIGGDFNTLFGSYFESGLKLLEEQGFHNLFSTREFHFPPRLDYFFIKRSKAEGKQVVGKGSDYQPILAKVKR